MDWSFPSRLELDEWLCPVQKNPASQQATTHPSANSAGYYKKPALKRGAGAYR
jgi:hypothetical protein